MNAIRPFAQFVSQLCERYPQAEAETIVHYLFSNLFPGTSKLAYVFYGFQSPEIQTNFPYLQNALNRLLTGEPVQYVVGEIAFYNCVFKINSGVLIPRPETEELVELILKENATNTNLMVLDIGSGSGCIPISIKKARSTFDVWALDKSKFALSLLEKNAANNSVEINVLELDALTSLATLEQQWDLIVSNPPYIPESEYEQLDSTVRDFEPKMALAVEDESPLLFYERIVAYAKTNLKLNGRVYFEINQQYGELTAALFDTTLFKVALLKDYSGNDRFIKAVRIAI